MMMMATKRNKYKMNLKIAGYYVVECPLMAMWVVRSIPRGEPHDGPARCSLLHKCLRLLHIAGMLNISC